jgi:hypothetical protein
VGGRDVSLLGNSTKTVYVHDDGSKSVVTTKKGEETSKNYDAQGKLTGIIKSSTSENVTIDKLYDEKGEYKGKMVYSADGKSDAIFFDKNGQQKKYDTGEGGNVLQAPTVEEFLRIKNFGGGYTDGRPELQSNTTMQKDPVEADPNFGVIDANPDYIESTTTPNVGNHAQPETRPGLKTEGPSPDAPPTPGFDPHSNSN